MSSSEDLRLITDDGLSLEASVSLPEDLARAALVLCHPHPKMGGTMNAPLLVAVRDELLERGWAVLRFNFRGIGSSEGEASVGLEETKDAEAALAYVAERFPDVPRALAGWSFGAAVAVRVAARHPELAALVAIAPAVKGKPGITAGLPEPDEIDLAVPTLFIVGVNDDLVEPSDCHVWAETAGATSSEMKGANHFFWGKYENLATEVSDFLDGAIGEGLRD